MASRSAGSWIWAMPGGTSSRGRSPGRCQPCFVSALAVLQVLAMSSRSWLSYSYQSRFHLTPLSYETLEFASGFASEQCPEGIVAISTNTLRFVQRARTEAAGLTEALRFVLLFSHTFNDGKVTAACECEAALDPTASPAGSIFQDKKQCFHF